MTVRCRLPLICYQEVNDEEKNFGFTGCGIDIDNVRDSREG